MTREPSADNEPGRAAAPEFPAPCIEGGGGMTREPSADNEPRPAVAPELPAP